MLLFRISKCMIITDTLIMRNYNSPLTQGMGENEIHRETALSTLHNKHNNVLICALSESNRSELQPSTLIRHCCYTIIFVQTLCNKCHGSEAPHLTVPSKRKTVPNEDITGKDSL